MPDGVWDAVLVLIGAAIAAATTHGFNVRQEYRDKKARAFSLFIKASEAINDVMRTRREILGRLKLFEQANKRAPKQDEYWSAVTQFVMGAKSEISFVGEELALFETDGESIGALLEFLSFRQTLNRAVETYSDMRGQIGDAMAMLTEFKKDSVGFQGTSVVNIKERPDLHKQILEISDLCKQIVELSEEAETRARRIADLINAKLPSKFEPGHFTLNIALPRAGELLKDRA